MTTECMEEYYSFREKEKEKLIVKKNCPKKRDVVALKS